MRPEILADHLATTLRGLFTPRDKKTADLERTVAELKRMMDEKFAQQAATNAQQAATNTELRGEIKAVGGLVTRDLEPAHPAPSLADLASSSSAKH